MKTLAPTWTLLSSTVLLYSLSCSSDPVTSIELSVSYQESWGLEQFDIDIEGVQTSVAASPTVELWVPDSLDGEELSIAVSGMRTSDGKLERYAFGKTSATPEVGVAVKAQVTLSRLHCGAWCSEGESSCSGDSVVTCADLDEDSCLEWADPVACTGGDSCSLGACRSECINECATGELRCAGPGGVQECGNFDSDDCLEWSEPAPCAEGASCSAGTCADVCRDECTDGESSCSGGGVITCADRNLDGCTEWGPVTSCGDGQSCSAAEGQATCIDGCVDECSVNSCDGNTLRECGQFDADECLDRSPGTSCVPQDACMEGMCDPTAGCMTTAKVCEEPPPSECINETTLRTYEEVGLCGAGVCEYSHTDTECEGGCESGACNSIDSCSYENWSYGEIDAGRDASTFLQLSVVEQPANGLHVLYNERLSVSSYRLRYGYDQPGGAWKTEYVGGPEITEEFEGGFDVDTSGQVHLAYPKWAGGLDQHLWYAKRNGGGVWSAELVDDGASVGSFSVTLIDSTKTTHIFYYRAKELYDPESVSAPLLKEIWHASRADGTTAWALEPVETNEAERRFSASVTSGGELALTYVSGTKIRHARKAANGSWSYEDTTATTSTSLHTVGLRQRVGANGDLHVLLRDKKELWHLKRPTGGVWEKQSVHTSSAGGQYSEFWDADLGVDANNLFFVYTQNYDDSSRPVHLVSDWPSSPITQKLDPGRRALPVASVIAADRSMTVLYVDSDTKDLRFAKSECSTVQP